MKAIDFYYNFIPINCTLLLYTSKLSEVDDLDKDDTVTNLTHVFFSIVVVALIIAVLRH